MDLKVKAITHRLCHLAIRGDEKLNQVVGVIHAGGYTIPHNHKPLIGQKQMKQKYAYES